MQRSMAFYAHLTDTQHVGSKVDGYGGDTNGGGKGGVAADSLLRLTKA